MGWWTKDVDNGAAREDVVKEDTQRVGVTAIGSPRNRV